MAGLIGAPARLVTIPARAPHASEPEGIPFVLTQAERSKVAQYQAWLERRRRALNRADEAREAAAPNTGGVRA